MMVRTFIASIAVMAIAATADAQPSASPPQPQPQPQPQPPSQPPSQPAPPPLPPAQATATAWYRITLNDGRVLDVQIVGGDAVNYHVLTNGAVYSVPRTSVVASTPLAQPQAAPVVYAPPPAPPVAQPLDEDRSLLARNPRAAGWVYFGMGYLIVAPIALARRDNDSLASAGLIPLVGPLIWTLADDTNDPFEDGWDWLAGVDCLIQTFGIYLVITGGSEKRSQKSVQLTPMTGQGSHGFALTGSF